MYPEGVPTDFRAGWRMVHVYMADFATLTFFFATMKHSFKVFYERVQDTPIVMAGCEPQEYAW